MKGAKSAVLVDPIFGFHFMLIVGGKESDAVRKFCRKIRLPFPDIQLDRNKGSFSSNEGERFSGLIWVEHRASASTLAHECAHAANHVCRVLELNPTKKGDEFHASYTGWLMRNLNLLYHRRAK